MKRLIDDWFEGKSIYCIVRLLDMNDFEEYKTEIFFLKKKNQISMKIKIIIKIVGNIVFRVNGNWLIKCLSKTTSNLTILRLITVIIDSCI